MLIAKEIKCPYCHVLTIAKDGNKSEGIQNQRCKNCRRQFIRDRGISDQGAFPWTASCGHPLPSFGTDSIGKEIEDRYEVAMIARNFVVFEGGDGSGTTTQIKLLRQRFERKKPEKQLPSLWTTCEPTDGAIGALIRSALRGGLALQAGTLARLFSADRSEHVFAQNGVIDRCNRGELVVSDRYVLSSLAYQGIGCGDALPKALNEEFPAPEMLFFFDIEPEIALKRMENRRIREIFEYLDFQVKVRERYKALLPWYEEKGTITITVDAAKTPDAVAEDVWKALKNASLLKTAYES
ncbi:MAG: dTMP kinase [Treponema sp.]|jgi:dTMP kinase|nr:dTMP kinase [Treponema sp.]